MKISDDERRAIQTVIALGKAHGFGSLISHLNTAWAAHLVSLGMSEAAARRSTHGTGMPFLMQQDLIERGEWDETGKRYAAAKKARAKQ